MVYKPNNRSKSNNNKTNNKTVRSARSDSKINNSKSNSNSNRNSNSNSNRKTNSKTNSNIKSKTNSNIKSKDKFNDSPPTYQSIIDLLSVSVSATDPSNVTWKEQLQDYVILLLKYLFLVTILTLNFLGLSVSLNCNADNEFFQRIVSAIFAFFFGFVYLIINYYTYKVLSQGKICKMDRDKLFPFKA